MTTKKEHINDLIRSAINQNYVIWQLIKELNYIDNAIQSCDAASSKNQSWVKK